MKIKKNAAVLLTAAITANLIPFNFASFAEGEEEENWVDGAGTETWDNEVISDGNDGSQNTEDRETVTSGDYEYSYGEDGNARLETYLGEEREIEVPTEIDGRKVNALGDYTYACKNIVSVKIGANIESIGAETFEECVMLEKIEVSPDNTYYEAVDGVLYDEDIKTLIMYPPMKTDKVFDIPDTVETVGVAAVYHTNLEEILFPASLTYIDHHGFAENVKVKTADLSCTALEEIGDMAFAYCSSLSDVIFPKTLQRIDGASFALCSELKEIEFPMGLLSIGQNAFAATGLSEVRIPSSVQEIDYCAFGYDENLSADPNFVIYGVAGSAAQIYASDTDSEYEYQNQFAFIPKTEIKDSNGDLIETKSLGEIEYAVIDDEVWIVNVEQTAEELQVPNSIDGKQVVGLYDGAFYGSAATMILLPDGLKYINKMAFADCVCVPEIKIPETVEEIGSEVFAGCSSLTSITIPASVKTIGENLFDSCKSLAEINVADGNTAYSSEKGVLFDASKSKIIRYPVGAAAKSYKLPDSVKTVDVYSFLDVTNLTSVDLNNAETISDFAFYGCTGLKTVKFGKKLKSIGDSVFYNCVSLKSVDLGKSNAEIGVQTLGFYDGEEENEAALVSGFKIYCKKGSKAEAYAKENKIKCITGTIYIFGVHMNIGFFAAIIAAIVAAVGGFIGSAAYKSAKKKKADQNRSEVKKKVAEHMKQKQEEIDTEGYESILGDDENNEAEDNKNDEN